MNGSSLSLEPQTCTGHVGEFGVRASAPVYVFIGERHARSCEDSELAVLVSTMKNHGETSHHPTAASLVSPGSEQQSRHGMSQSQSQSECRG